MANIHPLSGIRIKDKNTRAANGKVRAPRDNQQGSVLILVLMVLSVLVVVTMESMRMMQVEQISSRVFASSLRDKSLARSGIAFAEVLLIDDLQEKEEDQGKQSDHPGEPWAAFLDQDKTLLPELQSGTVNGTITDEQGKFPINYLIDSEGNYREGYKKTFKHLLQSPPFELKPEEVQEILQGIKDWMDKDDLPAGEFGAETTYYRLRGEPECRNAPLTCIDELRLIRGVGDELFSGTKGRPGLKDMLTVHSNGKININTAPAEILAAMTGSALSRETASEFARAAIDYRGKSRHFDFLHEKDWYRNRVAGFSDVQFPPDMVSTTSSYFSVLVTAGSGNADTSIFCVLHRESGGEKARISKVMTEVR